jgi:hypothetical protein
MELPGKFDEVRSSHSAKTTGVKRVTIVGFVQRETGIGGQVVRGPGCQAEAD